MSEPWEFAQAPEPVAYQSPGPILLTPAGLATLRKLRTWALFLSILSFMGSGLSLLLTLGSILLAFTPGARAAGGPPPMLGIIFYLVSTVVLIFPAILLLRIFLSIGRLLALGTPENLETVLAAQHRFFLMASILTIILIVLAMITIGIVFTMAMSGGLPV